MKFGGYKMDLNDLLARYIEVNKKIENIDKIFQRYNPWSGENVDNLINSFFEAINQKNSSFSWLDVEDKLKEFKNEKDLNIHFGIPNHIQGDISEAQLYLCLVNPNIDMNLKNENIFKYYEIASKKNSEDSSLNMLKIDDNGTIKISKDKNFIKEHIVNTSNNSSIPYRELLTINSKNGQELPYYLGHYFARLFMDILQKKEKVQSFFSNLDKNQLDVLKNISKKIANLEAYPFRSQTPRFSLKDKKIKRFANEIVSSESKVGMLSARIIIWRIVKYLNNKDVEDKPIFLFRRFNTAWLPSIKNVLQIDLNYNTSETEEIIQNLHHEFFFTIGGPNYNNSTRSIGRNIYKGSSKLEYEEYKETFVGPFYKYNKKI